MQTLRTALVVPTLLLSLCAFAEGTREEAREVSDFEGVEVSNGLKAQVKVGPKSVRVSGDEKRLSQLRTEVVDGRLVVSMDRNSWFGSNSKGVLITISTPKLTHVEANSGAEVQAEATPAETFSAEASGGGELTVRNVDAKRLKVGSSGGAEVTLKGRADSANMDVSGGAEVHSEELGLKSLEVDASGGADVYASPTESVEGELSGGSTLHADSSPPRHKIEASGGSEAIFRKK